MSSVTIVVFILVGIVALFLIGYINHLLEKSKLDKARRKAELIDRYRRCASLSNSLPGQLMTVELKQLLNRLELHFVDELTRVDRQEPKHQVRAEELRQLMAKTADVPISNPSVKIMTDEQAKDVRFQLESLQTQLTRAAEERLIPVAQLKPAVAHIQLQLINLYLDYFRASGQRFMQQGQPRQARLAYERAVKLLKRQTAPQFTQQLPQFEQLLDRASKLVLEHTQKAVTQNNELAGAVDSEPVDEWKKKQLYD